MRAKEQRRAVNSQGILFNDSREALRSVAFQTLQGTCDKVLLKGAEQSRRLMMLQAAEVSDFQSFMTRTLSGSRLPRWPQEPVPQGPLRPVEVVASGNLRARAGLPPAGLCTEASFLNRAASASSVQYNFLVDYATPIGPYDRTGFMSSAHTASRPASRVRTPASVQ